MMPRLIAALLLALLSGCGQELLRDTASRSYMDGYNDGCTNGSATASNLTGRRQRDDARYAAEPDYAAGWNNGNRGCNGENLRVNPNNPMEQIDLDAPR